MILGFDLDNTIICYDSVFYDLALQQGLIAKQVERTKEAVKTAVQERHSNDAWTALQAQVYGPHITSAQPFPGAIELLAALQKRYTVHIVSHKTRYPAVGEQVDLHAAARGWLALHGLYSEDSPHTIFFEETRSAKVARISALSCSVFVDDLVEVFEEPHFPADTTKVLFSAKRASLPGVLHAPTWDVIGRIIRNTTTTPHI